MSKSVYSFLVTLLALLLISPIAGINYSSVEQNSALLSNVIDNSARGDYEVSIEFDNSNTGLLEVTRNEEISADFVVSNTGTFDDTYDLSVTWDDEYDLGWESVANQNTVSVSSGSNEVISFTFQSPVQGVYDGDSMDFVEIGRAHV